MADEHEEAAEEEEDVDYDALPLNDAAYWRHFYAADDEPDFYEASGTRSRHLHAHRP